VPADHLLQASYAATRVAIQGTLMDHWYDGVQHVLELQSGFVAFRARMASHGRSLSLPPDGSRLKLTGVYVPQGLDVVSGNVAGFELLLSSPADIQVLSTPPWWTLKRVLVLACILATLLGVVLVWNTEIRNRQQSETQRAAEAERSRIARDLHDELGTGLTEVSLLAGAGLLEKPGAGDNRDRFRVIAEKASALVSGLDVIVWAIDPKRNSLQSFADYLGRYATELFSSSNILCRFKIPIECDAATLDESSRHSLFLAVKEALNNVIRHAGATEVELRISQSAECLEVVIADNGRGFDWKLIRRGNGLENLQERLKALNGQCDIHSEPGKGTTIKFAIPLAPTPNSTVHPVTDSNPS
jgi:signal transduction histidine kinase